MIQINTNNHIISELHLQSILISRMKYKRLTIMTPYFSRLVVSVAVGEHAIEVRNALLRTTVMSRLKALLNCSHVHWMLDDLVIIL